MKAEFISSRQELDNVYTYFFRPLSDLLWQAGQYINYTLDGVPPSQSERLFTIASAPFENHLQVTTIAGPSEFKQRLRGLVAGDTVEIDQLGGDFVYQEDGRDKLYLAGGIGITPYRSIVLDRYHNQLSNNAVLLYAGRPGHRPFLDEFVAIEEADPTFIKLDYEDKRLNAVEILSAVPDTKDRTVYIAGPQPFVEGLGQELVDVGVPKNQIKFDWFDGYHGIE